MVGFGKRLGNGADKLTVSRGKSLLDESGKAADEVDPGFARRLLERFANITGSPFAEAASIAIGVTDILLFIIGIPYVFSISSPTGTSLPQRRMILS